MLKVQKSKAFRLVVALSCCILIALFINSYVKAFSCWPTYELVWYDGPYSQCDDYPCTTNPGFNLVKRHRYSVLFPGERQRVKDYYVSGQCCYYLDHCWGAFSEKTYDGAWEVLWWPGRITEGGTLFLPTKCGFGPQDSAYLYPDDLNETCYPTPTPEPTPICDFCTTDRDCEGCTNIEPPVICTGPGGICIHSDGTPLIIDIDGDGYDLTDYSGGIRFDLHPDGSPEKYSWTNTNSDDAWLILDRNNNGVIDDGSELFGNYTPQSQNTEKNGFEALAEFDKPVHGGNGDKKVSMDDKVFQSLRLWVDTNHNGMSESTELLTLNSKGIQWIELDYKESKKMDAHGNRFKYRAKIKDINGSNVGRWIYDVYLLGK